MSTGPHPARRVRLSPAHPAALTLLLLLSRSPQNVTFGLADTVGLMAAVAPANSIQTYLWQRQ